MKSVNCRHLELSPVRKLGLPHFLTNIKQTNVKIFSRLDNPVLIIVNNWDLKGHLINLNHKKCVSIVVPMMFNLS